MVILDILKQTDIKATLTKEGKKMNADSNDDVIVFFGGGRAVPAKMISRSNKTHLVFFLPHLNPGSETDIIEQIEARTSCTTARRAIVKKVSGNNNVSGRPLRASIELAFCQNDFSPAPVDQSRISLAPAQASKPLDAVITTAPGADRNTMLAEYEIPDAKIGEEVRIQDGFGGMIKARIEEAKFESKNSGVNIAACIVRVTQFGYEPAHEIEDKIHEDSTLAEPKSQEEEPPVQTQAKPDPSADENPPSSVDESRNRETEPPLKATLPDVTQKRIPATKINPLVLLASGALGMLIAMVTTGIWYLAEEGEKPTAIQTSVQNPMPTMSAAPPLNSDEEITRLLAEDEPIYLPMTTQNLQNFFGQSNALKMPGKLSGKTLSGKLGVSCPTSPPYSQATDTTDVSACFVSLPANATAGEFPLTKETAKAWFHQDDTACFREINSETSAGANRSKTRLRINAERCDWHFDAIKNCFDYSKCTFTIPSFEQ